MPNLDSYRAILAGSVVFKGLTDGLYVALEGEVEVFLPERAGSGAHRPSRIRLNRLGPGRCLGEYGVIDDQPSSASAEALTPREALLPVQGGVPPARRAARSPRPDRLRQPAPLSRQPAARQGQGARYLPARREVTAPRRRDP